MSSGGLPGLTATAEEVYSRTYPRVVAKNAEFAPDVDPLLFTGERPASTSSAGLWTWPQAAAEPTICSKAGAAGHRVDRHRPGRS